MIEGSNGSRDIARIVAADNSQLTSVLDIVTGTDISGMTVVFDTTQEPNVDQAFWNGGYNVSPNLNRIGWVFGILWSPNRMEYVIAYGEFDRIVHKCKVYIIYQNGDWRNTGLMIDYAQGSEIEVIGTENQGWNLDSFKFPTIENMSQIIETNFLTRRGLYPENVPFWEYVKIGYPEKDRLIIGDGTTPVKIDVPENERIIAKHGDIEETIAYTSDIPSKTSELENDAGFLTLANLPSISRIDVTQMFTTSVPIEDFHVEMVDFGEGEKPLIRMWGQDTSGTSNTLVVTAANGFGSYYNNTGVDAFVIHGKLTVDGDGNRTVSHYPVDVTSETNLAQTTITFAPEIGHFDLTYFLGHTEASRISYYVDTNGVSHEFNSTNTPISNFCDNNPPFMTISIGGNDVYKESISELVFGDDYKSVTTIGDNFCKYLSQLQNIDLYGLSNITTTPFDFLSNTGIVYLDLSTLTNWTNSYFICGFVSNLQAIQIGAFDINNLTISDSDAGSSFMSATIYGTLYANTQQLGQAFKEKFLTFRDWNIVVNS